MSSGKFLFERKTVEIFENDISMLGAFVWFVSKARFEDGKGIINGNFVELKRGQFITSYRFLAETFSWSKTKVSKFLKLLKTESYIETQTVQGQTIITICNYNEIQDFKKSAETQKGQQEYRKKDESGTAKKTGSGTASGTAEETQVVPQVVPQPVLNITNGTNGTNGTKQLNEEDPENPMWFEGKIIRLRKKDYKSWFKRYDGTDDQFYDYLNDRDEWYAKQPPQVRKNWFMATANDIARMQGALN